MLVRSDGVQLAGDEGPRGRVIGREGALGLRKHLGGEPGRARRGHEDQSRGYLRVGDREVDRDASAQACSEDHRSGRVEPIDHGL